MKSERELFEGSEFVKTIIHNYEWSDEFNSYQIKDCVINGNVFDFIEAKKDQPILNGAWFGWQASAQREGYKLVPVEPTKEHIHKFEEITVNGDDARKYICIYCGFEKSESFND